MRPLWIGFFTVSFLLGACGYTSRSLMRQNVNTVYISIFDNQTFRRGLEFDLTNALKNEVLYKTRLKVVDKDHADSALSGTITDVQEGVLIEDPKGDIVESSVIIFVNFSWVDLRTGRTIVKKQNVTQRAEFRPRRRETVATASNQAFVDLAERIVNLMEEEW
jgi:hypothetical protein